MKPFPINPYVMDQLLDEAYRPLARSTQASYRRGLNRYATYCNQALEDALCDFLAGGARRRLRMLDLWMTERRRLGDPENTIHQDLSALKKLLREAIAQNYTSGPLLFPTAEVAAYKGSRWNTPAEIKQLRKYLECRPVGETLTERVLLHCFVDLLLRPSEVQQLRLEDWDPTQGLYVPGAERLIIPRSQCHVGLWKEAWKAHGAPSQIQSLGKYLLPFPRPDGSIPTKRKVSRSSINTMVTKFAAEAGLAHCSPRTLRHAGVFLLLEQHRGNVDKVAPLARMNHRNLWHLRAEIEKKEKTSWGRSYVDWQKNAHNLGKITDAQLAKKLRVETRIVTMERNRRGIPRWKSGVPSRLQELDTNIQLLDESHDHAIAAKLDLPVTCVNNRRKWLEP